MNDLTIRNPQSAIRNWSLRIGGTVLFIALLVYLDLRGDLPLEGIFRALGEANLLLVGLSIALYVVFLGVKAARWRLVAGDMGMPLTWGQAWRIYAIGLAAGTFTPGQAGDTLKAWYLQRIGYGLGRALGSSLLDRLFDVAALAVLGLLGVAAYGGIFVGQAPALIGLALLCVGMVAFFAYNRTRQWAVNLVARRLARIRGQGPGVGDQSAEWSIRSRTVAYITLLTVASFTVSIFRVWLLAAGLGVWLGPLEVSGYVGLTTAAALVPVTVGGIGTRDVVSVLVLRQLGYPPEVGVALSVLILVLNFAQAIAGWLVWLRYRTA